MPENSTKQGRRREKEITINGQISLKGEGGKRWLPLKGDTGGSTRRRLDPVKKVSSGTEFINPQNFMGGNFTIHVKVTGNGGGEPQDSTNPKGGTDCSIVLLEGHGRKAGWHIGQERRSNGRAHYPQKGNKKVGKPSTAIQKRK